MSAHHHHHIPDVAAAANAGANAVVRCSFDVPSGANRRILVPRRTCRAATRAIGTLIGRAASP